MNEKLTVGFKAGDVVRLRSGGPRMTVDEVSEDGSNVHTAWFTHKKEHIVEGDFSPEMLDKVDCTALLK